MHAYGDDERNAIQFNPIQRTMNTILYCCGGTLQVCILYSSIHESIS